MNPKRSFVRFIHNVRKGRYSFMKKAISLLAVLAMLCAALCGAAAAENDAEEFYRNGAMEMVWVTKPAVFSEGLAWVWYQYSERDSTSYVSMVNTQGMFLYSPPEYVSYVSDFHEGTAYYTIMDPNLRTQPVNQSDVLIDSWGREIYRTEGDEYSPVKWERICGYTNGVYILVRSVSGMTDEATEVALMRPDGTMAMDYTHDFQSISDAYIPADPADPLGGVRYTRDVGYAGKGWYWIGSMLFNVETHQCNAFTGRVYSGFDHGGVVVLDSGTGTVMVDENMKFAGVAHWTYSMPEREAFQADGMYYGNRNYYDLDNRHVIIPLEDRYPNNRIDCTPFYGGDYALMEIEGKDGHTYLTMIDRQGQEMFTPVMVRDYIPRVMDGYAVVAPEIPGEENSEKEYMILDSHGNLCHSVTKDFGGREIITHASFASEPDYLYSEGWLVLRYSDSTGRWFRFYPLLYAAGLGDEIYEVCFPE